MDHEESYARRDSNIPTNSNEKQQFGTSAARQAAHFLKLLADFAWLPDDVKAQVAALIKGAVANAASAEK